MIDIRFDSFDSFHLSPLIGDSARASHVRAMSFGHPKNEKRDDQELRPPHLGPPNGFYTLSSALCSFSQASALDYIYTRKHSVKNTMIVATTKFETLFYRPFDHSISVLFRLPGVGVQEWRPIGGLDPDSSQHHEHSFHSIALGWSNGIRHATRNDRVGRVSSLGSLFGASIAHLWRPGDRSSDHPFVWLVVTNP